MQKYDPIEGGLAGAILASRPQLPDPNFSEALVYLVEQDKVGAFGLVMNRPLGKTLSDVVAGTVGEGSLSGTKVYVGGPVQTQQLLLAHFDQDEETRQIICRVGLSEEQAEAYVANQQGWLRAFLGYSGWGEGQLEREIDEGTWRILRPDASLFRTDFELGIWASYVGADQRWRSLVRHIPEHPWMN
ncbi:MAG: YqgE/AlgH family protein [Verrucomicrobia bacterium]|nr:YqgE/AlgH family protein [Kiritimatiellia bacterium]MCB1102629.1 YqgE/AlgH family protein [Kiritimatiellia bacterium]MCP5487986.1 YqgE/AlgH family protein [Verrucomicrobiota bacterium]